MTDWLSGLSAPPRYRCGFPKTLGAGRKLAVLKAEAAHWLSDSEYVALRFRLEAAHAAIEAALEETRGRVFLEVGILGSIHKSQPILSSLSYIAVSCLGYKNSTG
jgi:hypothetical protein